MDRRNRKAIVQHKPNEPVDHQVPAESAHETIAHDGQKRENPREKHNQNVCAEQRRPEESGESHGGRRIAVRQKRRFVHTEIYIRRLFQFLQKLNSEIGS